MRTITAVIRARPGAEAALRAALLEVAAHVAAHEPRTRGFFLSQGAEDARVFTTYERFDDEAAMAAHNGSPAVARFFETARPLIEGEVILVTAEEFSVRP